MTKVFQSSTSKILSTNTANIIELNKENIIESDSEFREVVKKGYLLNNINLSTIPDIIKDAINQAMIDTKDATLSDALIDTLRTSLQNLDDGIYKKTYIDNTITYLENLLTSKVNLETVASIADNKLAIALQGFATTSSVSTLSSRVENSETEIQNVKQTINTKDTARALQIEQMEARVNDTFAGYSEAIDLIVDDNGNVKSQKIETLTTNIGLQLQEVNQLIVDTNNEWNAKSIKFITSPSGAITGYSFQDGSGVKSNFDINADNFKISNSTNTYTPFSIIDNNIVFNGKVSFSNTTTSNGQTLVNVLDELRNQIDGNITTWFKNGVPTLLNEPSNAWNTDELKNQHLGDIYYDNVTGYSYRFAHEDINDSPDMGIIYSWVRLSDTDITKALQDAATANNLLSDIANDNKLTPNEKLNTKKEWDIIVSEKDKNVIQATTYTVNTTAYTTAYDTLNTYITPLLTDLTSTSTIVGTTFRANFKAYYDARTDLLNAIATKIKSDLITIINNLTKVEDISWQQEVQNAINNNATYVDGSKVVTNQALVNNLNATGGIIAETVTANEFVGKTFTGAVINGAVINGSVVKASYLDLDGQLEVLTNYHITPAMYNANPSLYTDAVYISGNNEYRIPSLSLVREPINTIWLGEAGHSASTVVKSYDTANVGNNLKVVKIRPQISYSGNILTIAVRVPPASFSAFVDNYSHQVALYYFGAHVGTFRIHTHMQEESGGNENTIYTYYTEFLVNGAVSGGFSTNIYGCNFSASFVSGSNFGEFSYININMSSDTVLPINFNAGMNICTAIVESSPVYGQSSYIQNPTDGYAQFKTSSNMYINNMI